MKPSLIKLRYLHRKAVNADFFCRPKQRIDYDYWDMFSESWLPAPSGPLTNMGLPAARWMRIRPKAPDTGLCHFCGLHQPVVGAHDCDDRLFQKRIIITKSNADPTFRISCQSRHWAVGGDTFYDTMPRARMAYFKAAQKGLYNNE